MAKNKGVHEDLAGLEDAWGGSEAKTGSGGVPNADYICKLSDMEVSKSKAGNLQVVSTLEVQEGVNAGKDILRFDQLTTDEGPAYFKGYCEIIGLEPPRKLVDLPDAIAEFMGDFSGLLRVTVKTKGEFRNVYVNGLVDYEEGELDEGGGEPEPDADPSSDVEPLTADDFEVGDAIELTGKNDKTSEGEVTKKLKTALYVKIGKKEPKKYTNADLERLQAAEIL